MKQLGTWVCAALTIAAVGCKKSDEAESQGSGKTTVKTGTGTGTASASATGTASASATGTASASASGTGTASGTATSTTALTPDAMMKRYNECWGFFNDRKWDDFAGCFNDDAKSMTVDSGQPDKVGGKAIADDAKEFATAFPDAKGDVQLTLQWQNHIVGLVLITGTNDGAMHSDKGDMPATHKKLGMYIAHVIDMDAATGKATSETSFIDQGTMLGQLGVIQAKVADASVAKPLAAKEMVASTDSDTEKKNLESHHGAVDAFNKHDVAALEANRAPDVMWYEPNMPKEANQKEMEAGLQQLWKMSPDLKIEVAGEFAAGDYVVHYGQMAGTMASKPMAMKYMQIQHFNKDGKVDHGWVFTNTLPMMMAAGGK